MLRVVNAGHPRLLTPADTGNTRPVLVARRAWRRRAALSSLVARAATHRERLDDSSRRREGRRAASGWNREDRRSIAGRAGCPRKTTYREDRVSRRSRALRARSAAWYSRMLLVDTPEWMRRRRHTERIMAVTMW